MALQATPTYALQPSSEQIALSTNYITSFDFLDQYLPDVAEKEFERYGNRSVASFLRHVSAEIPSTSDLIKWTEQGRLHTKYIDVNADDAAATDTAEFTVNDTLIPNVGGLAIRVGQTLVVSDNGGSGLNKGLVTDVTGSVVTIAFYEAGGQVMAQNTTCTIFIYGSEFAKGTDGMVGSNESSSTFLDNKPIILKDKYSVNGSDMAQIGWVEVESDGGTGYLWYMKSASDTRQRFDDYLETSMVEAVPAEAASGAIAVLPTGGSDGIFYSVSDRGNVFGGGNPTTLSEWDSVIGRLDKQGAIEENVVFLNRQFGFDIDDMLAAQNSYGGGGTSYGLFNNDKDMALNLGFTGFRRGYDFYKTDWKYLNDPTMRGGLSSGAVNGLLVPAGTMSVYDEVMGKNAKRPFLHVRYRASETENRKYKTWVTGSAGGAQTTDLDAMEVNFLSERCVCTLGANNFMLFEQ